MSEEATERIFTRGFIIGTVINFLLYVNYYVLMVVMATYCASTFDTDLSLSGLAASIFIIGALIARFLGGGFIDRIGRKRSLVIATAAEALLSACYLFGGGLGAMFAVRALHGFFYGIAQTTVTSIVTSQVPDSRKGEGIGYYMLSSTIGSAVGPFLGIGLMQWVGFGPLFTMCTAVAVASLLGALTVREAKAHAGEANLATTEKTGKATFGLSSFIEPDALPISTVMGIAYLAYGAIITYLSAYALSEGLAVAATFFFVVYSAMMLVCRPITGKMFDRRGPLAVMVGGMAAFAVGMVLLGCASTDAAVLFAAAFVGLGIGATQPAGLTIAVQKSPDSQLTVANSTYFVFLDLAIGICPLIFGWMVPAIGYRGLYLSLVAVIIVSLVLYLVFRKRSLA